MASTFDRTNTGLIDLALQKRDVASSHLVKVKMNWNPSRSFMKAMYCTSTLIFCISFALTSSLSAARLDLASDNIMEREPRLRVREDLDLIVQLHFEFLKHECVFVHLHSELVHLVLVVSPHQGQLVVQETSIRRVRSAHNASAGWCTCHSISLATKRSWNKSFWQRLITSRNCLGRVCHCRCNGRICCGCASGLLFLGQLQEIRKLVPLNFSKNGGDGVF